MGAVYIVLVICHWATLAALVAGYTLSISRGVISEVMVWAARIQLLIGLALVGVGEMGDETFNHAKIGAKLVIALFVVVMCEISRSRALKGRGNPTLTHVAAGGVIANVIVALLWQTGS